MSEKLRRQIIEKHGPVLGEILFEAEFARRTRITERARKLAAELAEARAQFDAHSTQLAENLPPLRAAMDEAYEKWLSACNALEGQRVRNDATLSPLMTRIGELVKQINEPVFAEGLIQWEVPDWYQPTQDIPPMARH
jgi:hypothetical protein